MMSRLPPVRITASIRLLLAAIFGSWLLLSCTDGSDHREPQQPEPGPLLSAREAATGSDLLTGPVARGRTGDFVLENDLFRVIVQKPGRQWLNIGTYGGNIIDLAARRADGSFNPDHFEELVTGINIENTPNYTDVRVVEDGSNGVEASVCATGPDDTFEYANASSAIRRLGFAFPDSADDRDLPLEIETCYRLAPGQSYLIIDTTLRNPGADTLGVYHVEYLSGSGQVEPYQPQAGFGLPQVNPACPAATRVRCTATGSGQCDQCNYIAYSGIDGAAGVSYGLIHEEEGSSSFSDNGINALVLGQDVLTLLLTQAAPNYVIPGAGELTLRRYLAVGDGTVASIADIRNELFGFETGELSGRATSAGEPLAGAQVAVFQTTAPGTLFMAGHTRTAEDGSYRMSLPPGNYSARANMEGYLFDPADPREVVVTGGEDTSLDFELPAPGYLEVTVLDQQGPVPAKLQLVGFDPSPPLLNTVSGSKAGVFGDVRADALPYGVALAAFIGADGDSGRLTVEPGDYQLVVSRGPRYSAFKQLVTIASGEVTTVQAEIARVVETPGFIHADFHVHGIDSHDSEVTREERVAVYLAEGMDFFTPSDHDIRVDYRGTLEAMGVEHLVGTASSAETTTYDYGHFNSWPVTVDDSRLNGGAVDWGREAQPGMDFVEYGSFALSPGEIYDRLKADPLDNIVQINHIGSHFGPDGLAIDTAAVPPRSGVDLLAQRLDPSLENAFDAGFDALELWIGTNGLNGILDFRVRNLGDWFNLINQGLLKTGVASSDSHDRRFTRIAARTLVASEEEDPARLSAHAEQLARSVRAGKSIGTNAPFLLLEAIGRYQGVDRVAGLKVTDAPLIPVDPGSEVQLRATISTPAWAQVDRVQFFINTQPERTSAEGEAPRYDGEHCFAVVSDADPGWRRVDTVVEPAVPGAVRTDITATWRIPRAVKDLWIVAVASGTDGISEPLFPVLPASIDQASNSSLEDLIDGNLGEGGTPAFAFSNPVYVDVSGDGWTPPGVDIGTCSTGPAGE